MIIESVSKWLKKFDGGIAVSNGWKNSFVEPSLIKLLGQRYSVTSNCNVSAVLSPNFIFYRVKVTVIDCDCCLPRINSNCQSIKTPQEKKRNGILNNFLKPRAYRKNDFRKKINSCWTDRYCFIFSFTFWHC